MVCITKRALLPGVALLLCAQATVQAQGLSFGEAERQLVNVKQNQVQQADIQAREFEAQALDNLGLPQLSVTTAAIAYEKEISFTIPVINRKAELDINRSGLRSQVNVLWPLYTGGRTQATQELAQSRVSEAQAEQSIVQLQLLKKLSDLYFSTQMAQGVLAVRQQTVQTITQHVNRAQRFREEGLITDLDKMQADVALAEANRELILAKRQYTDLQAALKNLLELDQLECLATDIPTPVALTKDANAFVEEARSANPAYKKLAELLSQTERVIDIEKGKRLPEFFLAGSYELNKSATPLTEPDWSVGIGFKFNLISPVGRDASVLAATARREQVQLTKEKTDADLQLGIESTYRSVLQHLEQYELLSQDIALAEGYAKLQGRAFEEGLATSLEVTDAQLRLAAIQVKSLAAAFQYISSLAHLTQLSGRPEQLVDILPSLAQKNSCTNS